EHVRQPDVRSLNQHGRERLQICRRGEGGCVGRARKAGCRKEKLRVADAHDVSNRPRLKALRSQRVLEPWTYSAHDLAHCRVDGFSRLVSVRRSASPIVKFKYAFFLPNLYVFCV